jgi:hypothetical protein
MITNPIASAIAAAITDRNAVMAQKGVGPVALAAFLRVLWSRVRVGVIEVPTVVSRPGGFGARPDTKTAGRLSDEDVPRERSLRVSNLDEMRFQVEHRFNGSPSDVAALLTDPQFYETLVLPDVSEPEVLDSSADNQRSILRLRYEFTGNLDPMARRLLTKERLAWIQQVTVEHATCAGDLQFNAEADPKRFHGSAHFDLRADDGGCVRQLAGELVVAIPLIGSRAEGKIVPGILRRLDTEAQRVNVALAR